MKKHLALYKEVLVVLLIFFFTMRWIYANLFNFEAPFFSAVVSTLVVIIIYRLITRAENMMRNWVIKLQARAIAKGWRKARDEEAARADRAGR